MTEPDKWRKRVIHIALLLSVLSFFLMIYTGYEYKTSKTDEIILEKAKEDAHNKAENALEDISWEFNSTRLFTKGVAEKLSSGKLNDSTLDRYLQAEMENISKISSVYVAYSPAINAGKLHSHYLIWNGSVLNVSSIPYNYTDGSKKTAWYSNAVKKRVGGWNSPYFGAEDKAYHMEYSAPFYLPEFKNGSEVAGVVCTGHSLEGIRAHTKALDLGDTGFGFILSGEGTIISYPEQAYLFGNIHELAGRDTNLELISKSINRNRTEGVLNNSRTGQSSWVFYENISSTNWTTSWTMGIVLPVEETLLDKKVEQTRSVIQVFLAAFAFIFFLSLLFICRYKYDQGGLWMLAFIFSLFCILGMGIILHLTLNQSTLDGRNGDFAVFDVPDVERVLEHSNVSSEAHRIPTGVFIQSLQFLNAYDVSGTGFIWQNLSGTGIDFSSPSFSFPEAEETTIEKAYVDEQKGVVGWRFKTTIRQQFDYSKYPFDREEISIRIWRNASSGNVLTPVFNSYDSLLPETFPGLEHSLILEGWEPKKTFFSYRMNSYNTNFGIGDFTHYNESEFYFNVDIKRDFKAPFASDILPLIVVAILLFAVLVITTKDEKKDQCGFSSSGVLGYCSALFFVLIVAHSSLRNRIPVDNIIYLEYYYFILYLAILAVSLNSIAFASNTDIPFIDAKDNLYVKVLYWPVLMGVLLLITLLNFY
jgi:hypothetical protein